MEIEIIILVIYLWIIQFALKCSYCSEKYYGGLDVKYNIHELIEDLTKSNSFNENATFV